MAWRTVVCAPTPLRPTEDAVIVDSTELIFDQVVEYILKIVEEKTHE